jgi:mono/diheme cytochrome c family protein
VNKKIISVLMFVVLMLEGCGSGANSSNNNGTSSDGVPAEYAGRTNPFGAESVPAGAKVFKDYCSACHGATGHGDGSAGASLEPHPKNLAVFQSQVGDDYLFWRISTGKPSTAMVAWKGVLTDEQIWQVITFIRTLK